MLELSKETRISMLESRIQKLSASPKSLKSPGVLRRCRRELRNLKKN